MDAVGAVPKMWIIESQSGLAWKGPLKARVKRRSLGSRVFLIKGRKQGVCGRKGASFSWMKEKDLHACLQTPQHFPKCWFYAALSFDFFLSEELISLVVPAWEPVTMQQRCPALPPLPCPPPSPRCGPRYLTKPLENKAARLIQGIIRKPGAELR